MQEISKPTDLAAALAEGITLVDFWAPWCRACKALEPTLETLERTTPGLVVVKVNVEEPGGSDIANAYAVQSLPTIILFKDGKGLAKIQGNVTARMIKDNLEMAL